MLLGGPSGLSPRGTAPTASRVPGCPGSGLIGQRKSQVRLAARRGQPSTCRHRRAPRSSAAPRPLLFVTARTSCLWSPTRAHFPGREAAEGREFLGDTPTESRLPPPPHQLPFPTPTSPGNPHGTGAAGSGSLQRASRPDRRVAAGH